MSNIDTIREYLVKLGAEVDLESMVKFDSQLNKMSKKVTQVFSLLGKTVTRLSLAYSGLIVSTYKFSTSVAQSDIELQRWARRMYMTEDGARSLKRTLDAMGLSGLEDLQDVALNPELKGQFLELRRLADSLAPSQEVKNNLREIRAVAFEFTKLRLQMSYFIDNLVSSIYKHAKPTVDKFKNWLKDLNQSLFNNMDSWSDKLGKIIGDTINFIGRMIKRFIELLGDLKEFYEKFPHLSKAVIAGVGAWMVAFKSSGFLKTLLIFQSILTLYDDYKNYKEGSEDVKFSRLWRATEVGTFDEGGWADLIDFLWTKFAEFFDALTDEIGRIFRDITDWVITTLHEKWPGIFGIPESVIERNEQRAEERFLSWTRSPTNSKSVKESEEELEEKDYYNPTYKGEYNINVNVTGTNADEIAKALEPELELAFRRFKGMRP